MWGRGVRKPLKQGSKDGRLVTVEAQRNDRTNIRTQLAKLRQDTRERQGSARRKDQGYLRELAKVEEDVSVAPVQKKAKESRFSDNLAKDTSDFIWNTNWRKDLENWESKNKNPTDIQLSDEPDTQRGVSFARLSSLNDMSIDLSEELLKKNDSEDEGYSSDRTQNEVNVKKERLRSKQSEKWERSSRYKRETDTAYVQRKLVDTDKVSYSSDQYAEVKTDLFLFTAVTGVLGAGACYFAYDKDIAISFGVGSLASLLYLRLLSRSVDSLASSDLSTQVGGASGQARLLVPAILILGYNKWHTYVLQEYGLNINILPLLFGFFAYKGATFGQVFKSILRLAQGEDKKE